MRPNPLVKLETLNSTEYVYAYLENLATGQRFDFMFNPQAVDISASSNYEAQPTSGQNVPRQQFLYASGRAVTLDGLVMTVPTYDQSLRRLIDAIVDLTRSLPDQDIYYSPHVAFVWGSRRLEPMVITSATINETMWTNGEPVRATCQLSLLEVPRSQVPKKQTTNGTATTSAIKLTERQRSDGSAQAIGWLRGNVKKLRDERLTRRVRFNQFQIKTDDNGKVFVTDEKGKVIKEIGANAQGKFQPK